MDRPKILLFGGYELMLRSLLGWYTRRILESKSIVRNRQEENDHLNSETTIKAIQTSSPSGNL
jgi:hypothetical protein